MKELHFEIIDSTSSYLKRNYLELDNFTFVSASFQQTGRGRMNRTWISSNDENLLFSVLIKDKKLIEKFNYLSISTACIILETLKELGINDTFIKWPNDVYVKDKKICGILLESVSYDLEIKALIIGVGLNINASSFNNLDTATSLFLETNKRFDIDLIKSKIYEKMSIMFDVLENNYLKYIKIINKYNYLKDKKVYAYIDNEKQLVRVIKINDDGSLKINYNNKEIDINTGEITFHM